MSKYNINGNSWFKYGVTFSKNVQEAKVTRQEVIWCEHVEKLSKHEVLKNKKNSEAWTPALFEDDVRLDTKVISLSMIVLDFDDGAATLEYLEDRTRGLECFIHTTHQHSIESPRYRVIIPFCVPVPAEKWDEKWEKFYRFFEGKPDPSCRNKGHLYFYPSCSEENKEISEGKLYQGHLLDPDWIDNKELPELPEKVKPTKVSSQTQEARTEPSRALSEVLTNESVDYDELELVKKTLEEYWTTEKKNNYLKVSGEVDASSLEYAVILSLLNKNISSSAIFKGFNDSTFEGHYQRVLKEKNPGAAMKWFKTTFRNAAQRKADFPVTIREETKTRSLILHSIVDKAEFEGITNSITTRNLRRILHCHIDIYEKTGKNTWDAAVRELRTEKDISLGTISKHNITLSKLKWLMKHDRKKKTDASQFSFGEALLNLEKDETEKRSQNEHTYTHPNMCVVCSFGEQNESVSANEDDFQKCGVFTRGGLKHTARKVWEVVYASGEEGLSLKELREKSEFGRTAVWDKVNLLQQYGLVEVFGKTVKPVMNPDWEDIGAKLGTTHAKARIIAENEEERRRFMDNQLHREEILRRKKEIEEEVIAEALKPGPDEVGQPVDYIPDENSFIYDYIPPEDNSTSDLEDWFHLSFKDRENLFNLNIQSQKVCYLNC